VTPTNRVAPYLDKPAARPAVRAARKPSRAAVRLAKAALLAAYLAHLAVCSGLFWMCFVAYGSGYAAMVHGGDPMYFGDHPPRALLYAGVCGCVCGFFAAEKLADRLAAFCGERSFWALMWRRYH
jgi:hypothetical protein